MLESNGSVWSVRRLLAIKGGKDLGLSLETVKKTEPAKPKTDSSQDSSVKISLSETVQKLPVGQSLITVVEGQVRLLIGQLYFILASY